MAVIEIKGIDELMDKLGAVEAIEVLEGPMQRAVLRLQGRMATYPPPPLSSTYIRGYGFHGRPATSEKLGQHWMTKVTQQTVGYEGRVGNNVSYGPLVQSAMFQTKAHKRTGWVTDEQVLEEELPAILRDFEKVIEDALK